MKRAFLSELHTRAIRYFLDNQTADGLILDRQRNFAPWFRPAGAASPRPAWG